jgi:hypothetical protein
MTRDAATRIALVLIPVGAALLAALTRGAPTPPCQPSCGCGDSGTYSYVRSSPWRAQPMPAPALQEQTAATSREASAENGDGPSGMDR